MDREQVKETLRRVQLLIAKDELDEAISLLEQLIVERPSVVELYVVLAQTYERVGRWRDALATWRDVRKVDPSNPKFRSAIRRVLFAAASARMEESARAAGGRSESRVPPPAIPPADRAAAPDVSPSQRRRGDRRSGDRRRPGGSGDYTGPERRKGERRKAERRGSENDFDRLEHIRREAVARAVTTTALRASHLTKKYKRREVVSNVSLTVRQGEIVGLLGPNGAGKTTTFYMIVGLVRPNDGRIMIGDEDITRLPMYKRSRKGIGYLAQESSVFTHLSVEDNLHAVLEYQSLSRAERTARVDELIEEFRLETVRRSKGYMLSGGERRRTEIARAIAGRPRFFLLDEPFAGVDPIAVEDIQEIVGSLKERGIGVLITDHNVHETLAITDRAYLLYEGKILMQGSAEALANDPEVRKRYLGEKFKLERYG